MTETGKKDMIMCFDADRGCNLLSLEQALRKKPVDLDKVPHIVKNGHTYLTEPLDVPCGSCVACRMQRAKEWKIRNCLELQSHKEAYFLTLTYDDAHLPINENGQPYLRKRDLQLFMKRLRRNIGDFRYFASAEYGENTHRPHFHLILYGHLNGFQLLHPNQYTCPDIARTWSLGQHLVEQVTPGNIAYVSGYVEKKQKDPAYFDYPVKPFLMMSRKPGIGMMYFVKHYDSIKATQKVYGLFGEGTKNLVAGLPKSFKRNLDGIPWFEKFKEACRLAGVAMDETLKIVYRCKDITEIGDIVEHQLDERLARKERTL